jgi:lipoate---protein ligase
MSWRLVDSDLLEPAFSAAVDEAILLARNEGSVPNTLHLYRRTGPTISLGHFERINESIDIEAAERLRVSIVRRMSGGSAIYTDPDQLIYTVAVGKGSVPESPQDTFRLLCQGLIEALAVLGVRAEFKPVNDVLVGGRKISGSAQVRRHEVVLQHGTLLVRTDYERMFSVLRSDKRSRNEMTSLVEELGEAPPMAAVKIAIVRGFSEALGVEFEAGALSERERESADRLTRSTYGRQDHTLLY